MIVAGLHGIWLGVVSAAGGLVALVAAAALLQRFFGSAFHWLVKSQDVV